MKLFDRFFRTRRNSPRDSTERMELAVSPDELFAELKRDTMPLTEFRQRVLRFIWHDNPRALRELCQDQPIAAELFAEKGIAEIASGNKFNDMLWMMLRRLIDAGDFPYLLLELEAKRHLVPHPDLGRKAMEPFVVVGDRDRPIDDQTAKLPVSLLRLLHGDITGIDPQDSATIDRVFADLVIIGPGFFRKYLASMDFPYGDRAMMRCPVGRPPQMKIFEGRVLQGQTRLVPLVFDKFEDILARYRDGKIRDATQEERELFYSLVDFEIEGRPVYIIEAEEGKLLVYLQEGDRVHWIESLDMWSPEEGTKPLGALDSSILDDLRGELG